MSLTTRGATGIGPACMPCSGEGTTSMVRRKGSCIREMHQMQFFLLVTEPRAGWANGSRIRWEDVDDGSDGVAARPHGRMVNRTRDELTKTAQSKAVFDLASLGGIRKMESGCGLLFVGYRASFDCGDPLTPRSQLASTCIWRSLPC